MRPGGLINRLLAVKIMEYLNNILECRQLDSLDKVKSYVSAADHPVLEVLTASDLSLCSESRVYDEHVEYKNKIIDVKLLWIANAKNIKFINCIFLGKLLISQKHEGPCEVYIDYCIFTEALKIVDIENSESICLVSVNSPVISIENNQVKSIYCDSCRSVKFIILDNRSSIFRTFECNISYPFISRNIFESITFPYKQVNINKQKLFIKERRVKKEISNFNCFRYPNKIDLDDLSLSEKKQINKDTFRFILSESDIYIDKAAKSHVRYLSEIESHNSLVSKSVIWLFGALLKPIRIFVVLLCALFIFGFIYQLPCLVFNAPGVENASVVRNLSFSEAFYYSGITFTTVGYGDISPVGIARVVAIIEGLIGILLSSAFLASLIRKYTE
jgi:hypothetical protein